MMKRTLVWFAVLFLALVAHGAAAQAQAVSKDGFEHLSAAALKGFVDELAAAKKTSRPLSDRGNLTYAASRRDATGSAEVHEAWTDVIVVLSGKGTFIVGGTVTEGKPTTSGEIRGSAIAGGTRNAVGPGDVIVIPAGTPHQLELAAGDAIAYFGAKVAKP